MHIVTKVLVVFCAVLSVLLAALTVTYAANASTLADEAEALRTQLDVQAGANSAQASAWESAKRNLEAERDALLADRAGLRTDLSRAQAGERQARADLNEVEQASELAESKVGQLAATVRQQTQLLAALRDEGERLRTELLEGSRREIELVERITELENSNEVLTQNIRAMREQLAEARRTMASGMNPASGDSVQTFDPGVSIRTRVIDVTDVDSGERLVVIDEGSSGGVRDGMQFDIVRGDLFVGSIEIVSVEAQTAVGRITLGSTEAGVTVEPNDEALSSIQ